MRSDFRKRRQWSTTRPMPAFCACRQARKPISANRMSTNTFGHMFRITTFGESHGPALGCVVDGCPPGIPLTEPEIQVWLDKRRPGQGRYVSQRQEPDAVKIL